MSKPWATSHISDVAKGIGIEKRISGDVKSNLVKLLSSELNRITLEMEDATLSSDPDRKTLGDPSRTRLGFNRTRGMMIKTVKSLESVGSAAVVSVNEDLESYLLRLLILASQYAEDDKMNTIKIRHLNSALDSLEKSYISPDDNLDNNKFSDESGIDTNLSGSILTSTNIKLMVKNLAGMKIEEDALEDLLLVYYDHAAELQEDFQNNIRAGKIEEVKSNFERTKDLMMLGWLRRMLVQAGENAKASGASKISIGHVIRLDPWK